MKLAELIKGSSCPAGFATVTLATFATDPFQPKSSVATVATVTVTAADDSSFSEADTLLLLGWLDSIGETDQDLIQRIIDRCKTDEVSREFFLRKARDL
jgi:hypothetical protein